MLKIILCDDNLTFLNGLDSMLNKLFIKHNLNAEVSFKTDSHTELLNYIKNNPADLLFLDISLKEKISGLELAKEIRQFNKNIQFIFTTGHFEYVMEAYKVNTFDYLVKPLSQNKVEETLLRFVEYMKGSNNSFIKVNGTTYINQNDILYIQKNGMKLIYHTKTTQYETFNSFSKIETLLPNNFIRCHKSYIVNISNINHIESSNNTIFFHNNDFCYIGPKYKNNFMGVINCGDSSSNMEITYNS